MVVELDDNGAGINQRNRYLKDSEKGCPIYKYSQKYEIPSAKGSKHHKVTRADQFPLKLAWASTGHKIQGVTIKKGTNVVIHGNKHMPDSMYYVMLSRAQDISQVYLENFTGSIRANHDNLVENQNLVKRSIVHENKDVNVFLVNMPFNCSKAKTINFLQNDPYASHADHVCVVEKYLNHNEGEFPNR